MKTTSLLARTAAVCAVLTSADSFFARAESFEEPVVQGPFAPNWESLKQYKAPAWFRDAKFGIWAPWTAQCLPEQGDWYARHMYEQSVPDPKTGERKPTAHYTYHVEHYGHPSKFGFKDIDNLWRAERWDPEKLMALYKRAGAKYFMAMGNHHDNLDCFDSKYQPWNTVNVGPRKDLVEIWEGAARKAGLRFGVSIHAARAWDWFDVAHGSDSSGPMAGVRYDGWLTQADGVGQWWDGLDPKDLYGPSGAARTPEAKGAMNLKFFNRTLDLINKYEPDMLYFDDGVLPLNGQPGDYGLKIAAHFYNANLQAHDGKQEAVMNTKNLNEEQRRCLVWDIERGFSLRTEPYPWQACTCIGDWHYRKGIQYKTAADVIQNLCDVVSKNGNLLLSIPMRGDGTIDEQEVAVLKDLASWMDVNSEAIFSTRPWVKFGEGTITDPAEAEGKRLDFTEGKRRFSASDVRYTLKDGTLYAIVLGWPEDGTVTLRALAAGSPHYQTEVLSVNMLGSRSRIDFTRNAEGLQLKLPARKPKGFIEAACVFKIEPKKI
jgi:alpha-L-fucosidase